MNIKLTRSMVLSALAAIVFVGFAVAAYFGTTSQPVISFEDVSVDRGLDELGSRTDGLVTIKSLSGDQDSAIELVGTIAVRAIDATGAETWSFNPSFRPARDKVSVRPVDELLYRGIVSRTAKSEASLPEISANLGGDELAEISIRNQLILSFSDPRDVPYRELSEQRLEPEKQYYFIQSVIVTDINTRKFRKHDGKVAVSGMAFGANGAIYSSQEEVQSLKRLSFRPFDLSLLKVSEAGSATGIAPLVRKALENRLEEAEAGRLLDRLLETSKPNVPAALPIAEVPLGLPTPLRGMKQIVWHDEVHALRQSKPTSCWAAAAAMLYSYKYGRRVTEREAIVSVGTLWSEMYERGTGLLAEHKLRFLSEAGLVFVGPQSFFSEGLAGLLMRHGPLWFTIDLDEGTHASVLTGIFVDVFGEHWVSYIDPMDGELKADTFNGFMRRYEEPAWRWSEAHPGPVTLENFYVQVVHLAQTAREQDAL